MIRIPMASALALFLGLATEARPDAPLLKVGPTRRYLVDEAGNPFQLRGEAAWALPVQLTREEVAAYLDDRRAKGFNALLCEIINVKDGYASNAPLNAYGQAPFVADDFTQLVRAQSHNYRFESCNLVDVLLECVDDAWEATRRHGIEIVMSPGPDVAHSRIDRDLVARAIAERGPT